MRIFLAEETAQRMFNRFPMLEIGRLIMQLVKKFKTSMNYSRLVVQWLGIDKGDAVLDTCMRLWYTAIAAAAKDAAVKTIETRM